MNQYLEKSNPSKTTSNIKSSYDNSQKVSFLNNRPEVTLQLKHQENANKYSSKSQNIQKRSIPEHVGKVFSSNKSQEINLSDETNFNSKIIQRVKNLVEDGYYNGKKQIYSIEGQEGLFFKSLQKPVNGLTKYKKVERVEGSTNELPNYTAVKPEVIVEYDDRTDKEKWLDNLGGDFGDNYIVLPGSNYPHLSIEYHIVGEKLMFGDAHVSQSHEDPDRLSYLWKNGHWVYEKTREAIMFFAQKKQVGDEQIARANKFVATFYK